MSMYDSPLIHNRPWETGGGEIHILKFINDQWISATSLLRPLGSIEGLTHRTYNI